MTTRQPSRAVVSAGVVLATWTAAIGAGVVGLYEARRGILVAAIVAAVLSAAFVERLKPHDSEVRPTGDRVVLWVSGIGCALALGAALVIGVGWGFSPRKEALATQLDEIQRIPGAKHKAVSLRLGAKAHVFALPRRPEVTSSGRITYPPDEIRVYEEQEGGVEQRLSFRPRLPLGSHVGVADVFDPTAQASYAKLEPMETVDLNRDGQPEILSAYSVDAPLGMPLRVPVLVAWSAKQTRYLVLPVLTERPRLRTQPTVEDIFDARPYKHRYRFADDRSGSAVAGYAVSDYAAVSRDGVLVAAYRRGVRVRQLVPSQAIEVSVWDLPTAFPGDGAVQLCFRPDQTFPRMFERPPARDYKAALRGIYRTLPVALGGPVGVVLGAECGFGD